LRLQIEINSEVIQKSVSIPADVSLLVLGGGWGWGQKHWKQKTLI